MACATAATASLERRGVGLRRRRRAADLAHVLQRGGVHLVARWRAARSCAGCGCCGTCGHGNPARRLRESPAARRRPGLPRQPVPAAARTDPTITQDGGVPPDPLVARLRAAGCVFAEDEARLLRAAADRPPSSTSWPRAGSTARRWRRCSAGRSSAGCGSPSTPACSCPGSARRSWSRRPCGRAGPGAVVVDLCCGTGAIGAAVAAAVPGVEVHAADVDPAAVACARRNLPGARLPGRPLRRAARTAARAGRPPRRQRAVRAHRRDRHHAARGPRPRAPRRARRRRRRPRRPAPGRRRRPRLAAPRRRTADRDRCGPGAAHRRRLRRRGPRPARGATPRTRRW